MPSRRWIDREIQSLDPVRDYARIVTLMLDWRDTEPIIHHLIYTLGFIRQVADPTIAEVIDRGGMGRMVQATTARGDETLHFFGTWFRHGPESELGRASIERLNAIHHHFPITNAQYLYTLTTVAVFAHRLLRLMGLPGWSLAERRAFAEFWRQVAIVMRLADIPSDLQAFEDYFDQHEAAYFAPSEAGQRCAEHLVDDFAQRWFPGQVAQGRSYLLAHFDPPLRRVYRFDYPGPVATWLWRRSGAARGIWQRLTTPDATSPRYVMESFQPQRQRRAAPASDEALGV